MMTNLPKGTPTHSKDITGQVIKLGDIVTYDFKDEACEFEVIFEDNAFRKKYNDWDGTLTKPILEYRSRTCNDMRLLIKKKSQK